jgi:hypothetical protein
LFIRMATDGVISIPSLWLIFLKIILSNKKATLGSKSGFDFKE